jgi:hypothetical protein
MAEGHKIDDEFFTYQVVMNCRKVVVTDAPLYHYRIRSSGVMQNLGPHQERIMLDRVEYMTTRYQNIADKFPQLESVFFLNALDNITRYWYHSKNMPTAQGEIRRWVKKYTGRILTAPLSLRQKLGFLFQLYLKKPVIMSEPNPLATDSEEVFD